MMGGTSRSQVTQQHRIVRHLLLEKAKIKPPREAKQLPTNTPSSVSENGSIII